MSFFSGLFRIIAIILVIIAIIFFIYAALLAISEGAIGAALVAKLGPGYAFLEASAWAYLAIGFGVLAVAAIVSPEGFAEAMGRVSKGAEAVGEAVGNIVGGLTSGVLEGLGIKSFIPIFLVGLGLYWYSSGSSSDEADTTSDDADPGTSRTWERQGDYRDASTSYA